MVRKVLLVCGIFSALLYVGMNIFVPMQWTGYSSASQTVSELSAIGAPTRPQWVLLGIVFSVLLIAFGRGVWDSAHRNRRLRIVGGLLLSNGFISLVWPFAPMHRRGEPTTVSDSLHIVLAALTVILMFLAIGFGTSAFGKKFQHYSIASLVVLVMFGILSFRDGPRVAANLPTPWIGVWERINIGVFMLWIVMLAFILLNDSDSERQRSETR